MATNYPTSQDNSSTLPNPSATTQMNAGSVTHSALHDNTNDAIKALEAKVGYGNSTPAGASIFVSDASNNTKWSNLYGDVTSQGTYTTLASTGVSAGTYLSANITIDAKGRVISAVSGYTGGNSPLTTKGDVYTYSSAPTRLPVGADGQVLAADSTQTTGLKWVTAGVGNMNTSTYDPANIAQQVVGTTATQTLTNKTLTSPTISTISNTGTLTLPTTTDTLIGRATTDTITGVKTFGAAGNVGKLAIAGTTSGSTILNASATASGTLTLPAATDTLVGKATTDTLTNKTLTAPIISTISNTGTLTLPTSTDTLVGRATTDTLSNKTFSDTITSTLATGTSPLTVTSTTKVTNLNADTVDGIHASSTATANQLMALDGNAKFSSTILSNPYKFRVYRNAAQNSGNGAFAKINYDTKTYDTSSNFDTTTNFRFVAPVAGFYQFNARMSVVANGTAVIATMALYKNGAEYSRGNVFPASTAYMGPTVSDEIQLAAGDYVEVFGYSGGQAYEVGSNLNYFSGFLVSTL